VQQSIDAYDFIRVGDELMLAETLL